MKKISIIHLLILFLVVITLATYFSFMASFTQQQNKTKGLEEQIASLKKSGSANTSVNTPTPKLSETSTDSISAMDAIFPRGDGAQHFGIESINKDTMRVVNPFFKYKVTIPNNKYNVDITSWAEVVIANPSMGGAYVEIRATISDTFTPNKHLYPNLQGYDTEKTFTTSKATIAGVEATKYSYTTSAFDYYVFSKNGIKYSIRVSNFTKEKTEMESILKGITLD